MKLIPFLLFISVKGFSQQVPIELLVDKSLNSKIKEIKEVVLSINKGTGLLVFNICENLCPGANPIIIKKIILPVGIKGYFEKSKGIGDLDTLNIVESVYFKEALVHELGHVLGISHRDDAPNFMHSNIKYYRPISEEEYLEISRKFQNNK